MLNVQEDDDEQHNKYDEQDNSNHCNRSYDDGRVKRPIDPCTQTERITYLQW